MKRDESCILTCVCGCSSIRFDIFDDDPDIYVTPYAIAEYPFNIPKGFLGRVKAAWHVLLGGHPEPTLIINQEEQKQLQEFLQKVKEK